MMLSEKNLRPLSSRILLGMDEPIFTVLPERVIANLRHPTSENALLWNLIYPLALPTLGLVDILNIRPMWGTATLKEVGKDDLRPFFWGYSIAGSRLPYLDDVLEEVDGSGLQTEIDLFLVGDRNLVLAEVKHMSTLGRCSRYAHQRCPEIHAGDDAIGSYCRYWEMDGAKFSALLDFGSRPTIGVSPPPCHRHYQLGRTLLVGQRLSERLEKTLHLWMVLPRERWSSHERTWLDFTDRVRDDAIWRRMRVLAWEDIEKSTTKTT